VVGSVRDDAGAQRLAALGARAVRVDVADAASAAGLGRQIEGERFDVAIVNAGVYGARLAAMQVPSDADFDLVMHTNVLGAMRVLPQVAEALAPGARLAVVSSRMGSIGARTANSGWVYRASKAALNSVLKDVSIALAGRAVCVALHPGWVRTDMGGAGADLDVADSAAGIRRTLARLTDADHGGFFMFDGAPIPW
jgi:NAD(P)-dependent dehydrogenase (short-subunit alcohol dehydrogenase family)